MASQVRFMYLRNENKTPIGCLAIQLLRKKGELRYQLSVANPKDRFDPITRRSLPFEKEHARNLALGRLHAEPFVLDLNKDETMNGVSRQVMQAIVSAPRGMLPTRAVKAARVWLENVKNEQSEIIEEEITNYNGVEL